MTRPDPDDITLLGPTPEGTTLKIRNRHLDAIDTLARRLYPGADLAFYPEMFDANIDWTQKDLPYGVLKKAALAATPTQLYTPKRH